MTISGNVPAEVADKMNAPTDDELADDARLRERALADLVDRLMDGQEYPPRPTRQQINMLDILTAREASELARIIVRSIDTSFTCDLRDEIRRILRVDLENSVWHEQRIAEMREEEREEYQ